MIGVIAGLFGGFIMDFLTGVFSTCAAALSGRNDDES